MGIPGRKRGISKRSAIIRVRDIPVEIYDKNKDNDGVTKVDFAQGLARCNKMPLLYLKDVIKWQIIKQPLQFTHV